MHSDFYRIYGLGISDSDTRDLLKGALYYNSFSDILKNHYDVARFTKELTIKIPEVEEEKIYKIFEAELKVKETNILFKQDLNGAKSSTGFLNSDEDKILWSYTHYVHLEQNIVEIVLVSNKEDLLIKAENIAAKIKSLNKESEDNIKTEIYWMGNNNASSSFSVIKCPEWTDINKNYVKETSIKIELAMHRIKSENANGRLIIWHGRPGTGKTWAVRSLAQALKETHTPKIISDPDTFLGSSSYYFDIASESSKPSLFILEDAANSIISESRVLDGDKISRLLHLTDGLISQGRNDLFLVTFNENIKSIDPAILRPGRCLSTIEFKEFSAEESLEWLTFKGHNTEKFAPKNHTLAELYGILNEGVLNKNEIQTQKSIGFL